jgi:arylsulfatase A-like enzyme
LCGAIWLLLACVAWSAEAPKTNVIFILADDLGYGDLSCYGQKRFTTPRLDQMAAEGLRFTQHYAGCTVCAPSRACLLSGQHTGHVHQRINGSIKFRPDPQDICVSSLLKQVGYHTAMIGKSGLSCNSSDGGLPNRKGFDYFFGFTSHAAAHRYYPPFLWRNGAKQEYPGNHGKEGDQYTGDLFRDDVLKFLDEHHRERPGEPFFLHVALQQPHLDLSVPEQWKAPFRGKFNEAPVRDGHFRGEAEPIATFAGMIAHLDHTVGQIIDKLKKQGIAERTLVLFSSDNGAADAEGWSARNLHSSGPLRGAKRDMYEGGIRVPLIAWQPGTVRAGTTTEHVSAFWDFAPTVCDLAGCDPPPATDGISYLPTLHNSGTQAKHEYLYWEFYEQGGKQAVRWGDWKGVRLQVLSGAPRPIKLYNLADDPGEKRNVAAKHPEVVQQIAQFMREAHVPEGEFQIEPPTLKQIALRPAE